MTMLYYMYCLYICLFVDVVFCCCFFVNCFKVLCPHDHFVSNVESSDVF